MKQFILAREYLNFRYKRKMKEELQAVMREISSERPETKEPGQRISQNNRRWNQQRGVWLRWVII